MMKKPIDVLIVGAGPAGVTAALYTARAGLRTAILYKNHGALEKAPAVDNYYGHMEVGGKELINIGIVQARRVGATVTKEEVLAITQLENGLWCVQGAKKERVAKGVLIATGASRATPPIKGLKALEGRGVSYCAICDGFFHRGKDVAVIGSGPYALHEVGDLLPIANSVTVLTNGAKPTVQFPDNVTVRTEKIAEVLGQKAMMGENLKGVTLEGGDEILLSGLFVALGVAGGTDLARKLGAQVEGNAIVVNEHMSTSAPGLWAAGDCTGGLKQIAKATYEGALAGLDMVRHAKTMS